VLGELTAVDIDLPVVGGDGLPRQSDHPLDEVRDPGRGVVGGLLEDHDVTTVGAMEVVAQLVDQEPVPHVQGRLHRTRRNVERLNDKGPDEHRGQNRNGQDDAPFDDHPERRTRTSLFRRVRLRSCLALSRFGRQGGGHDARRY
jgi:hypothetical protein